MKYTIQLIRKNKWKKNMYVYKEIKQKCKMNKLKLILIESYSKRNTNQLKHYQINIKTKLIHYMMILII